MKKSKNVYFKRGIISLLAIAMISSVQPIALGEEVTSQNTEIIEQQAQEQENTQENIDETELEEDIQNNIEPLNNQNKIPTEDTFNKVIGEYSIKNILKNYNVFSSKDIEGTHIVGPIAAQNKAYRTRSYNQIPKYSGKLIASDFSNKIPSYVGIVEKLQSENATTFALNYGFETSLNPKPNLYVNYSNNSVKENNSTYKFINSDGSEYTSPNNSGNSPVFQNDEFINFDTARNAIIAESRLMLTNPQNIVVSPDPQTGYLKVKAGQKYLVKNADRLRIIDIDYPKGYHPYEPGKKPYPYNTIINIEGSELISSGQAFTGVQPIPNTELDGAEQATHYITSRTYTNIDGKPHYYLPIMLINGKTFNGAISTGQGFEYGQNNGLIFNMPNINTETSGKRVAREDLSDIPGHIVAPDMEFWNYDNKNGSTDWIGGNLNGGAIVKDWHSGNMECHQWSYDVGDVVDPSNIDFKFQAQKIFTGGNLNDNKFKFILELFEGDKVPEGMLNKNIPQNIEVQSDGSIKFLPLTFTKEGTYSFRIKEDIPNPAQENITYDKSQYKLDITVKKDTSNPNAHKFLLTQKITKIIDKDGNILTTPEELSQIIFENKLKEPELEELGFIIKKIDNITMELLKGAEFDLYLANDTTGKPVGSPIITKITTSDDGTISVNHPSLKTNTLYVLQETKAPDGYISGKEINFYIKGDEGLFPNIEDKVVIGNGEIIIVENEKQPFELPSTGGTGSNVYILTGICTIISSTIFLQNKKTKNRG